MIRLELTSLECRTNPSVPLVDPTGIPVINNPQVPNAQTTPPPATPSTSPIDPFITTIIINILTGLTPQP